MVPCKSTTRTASFIRKGFTAPWKHLESHPLEMLVEFKPFHDGLADGLILMTPAFCHENRG
jgi:hypothetical protein